MPDRTLQVEMLNDCIKYKATPGIRGWGWLHEREGLQGRPGEYSRDGVVCGAAGMVEQLQPETATVGGAAWDILSS